MDYLELTAFIKGRDLSGELKFPQRSGVVCGFSDDSFLRLELRLVGESHVAVGCTDIEGLPYNGNINAFVGRALAEQATVGFAVDSAQIAEHLEKKGTFKFKGETPIKYHRGNRKYYVF